MATIEPLGFRWKLMYYHYKFYILLITSIIAFIGLAFYVAPHTSYLRKYDVIRDDDIARSIKDKQTTPLNIVMTLTNAATNHNLKSRFEKCVESIIKHSSISLHFNIIGDEKSHVLAEHIFNDLHIKYKLDYTIEYILIGDVVNKYESIVKKMQDTFSSKPGSYYNNPLFFLSPLLHMTLSYDKVIMLDSDLIFQEDIEKLSAFFNDFSVDQMVGIAHEQQPVYRHTFYKYRNLHPDTKVGDPPPNGLTGFNSGVLLLDLAKIRQSKLYNSLMEKPENIKSLSLTYEFQGHLGDQDFYTLLEMDGGRYEKLFYVLPCSWNRQLCRWWEQGYKEVFDLYHKCDGKINIWHGNCNTPIPVNP